MLKLLLTDRIIFDSLNSYLFDLYHDIITLTTIILTFFNEKESRDFFLLPFFVPIFAIQSEIVRKNKLLLNVSQ